MLCLISDGFDLYLASAIEVSRRNNGSDRFVITKECCILEVKVSPECNVRKICSALNDIGFLDACGLHASVEICKCHSGLFPNTTRCRLSGVWIH